MLAQPTVDQFLASNTDRSGYELTNDGRANLIALRELAAGGPAAAIPTAPGISTSTTAATQAQGTKAVASAGTPVLLVAAQTLVQPVVITAQKGVATLNTGNIYVGFSATPGANLIVLSPGAAGPPVTPGDSVVFEAPAGKKIDLHTIYIDAATNADAVAYTSLN